MDYTYIALFCSGLVATVLGILVAAFLWPITTPIIILLLIMLGIAALVQKLVTVTHNS